MESIEYSETFIGECTVGRCGRPATVRVYEDYVLCAHHYLHHELSDEEDSANLALELIKGWHSIANMHDNGYLKELFHRAEYELKERKAEVEGWIVQMDRIDYEVEEGEAGIRRKMDAQARASEQEKAGASEQEKAGALPELSALGRQLVALTRYPGEDLTRLARDMVRTAGWKEDMAPYLEDKMRSKNAEELPSGFLDDLAKGLGLTEPERIGLAMSYTFDGYTPPEQEPHREEAGPENGGAASA